MQNCPATPYYFGVLVSSWTIQKIETRKFAFSWEMKSVSGPWSSTVSLFCDHQQVRKHEIFAESGPSGPVGSLQHYCASVCLSVSSINAWASNSSLNGGSTWRPVLSSRGRPLPASRIQSVRESIHVFTPLFTRSRSNHRYRSAASCGRLALCRVVWIVLFARARVSSVLVVSAFHASLKLCAPYIL